MLFHSNRVAVTRLLPFSNCFWAKSSLVRFTALRFSLPTFSFFTFIITTTIGCKVSRCFHLFFFLNNDKWRSIRSSTPLAIAVCEWKAHSVTEQDNFKDICVEILPFPLSSSDFKVVSRAAPSWTVGTRCAFSRALHAPFRCFRMNISVPSLKCFPCFLRSVSTRLAEHSTGDMLSVTCNSPLHYICLNLSPFAILMSRVKLIFGLEYLERNETIRQTQLIHFEMKSITIKYTQSAETVNHYAITLFPIFLFESCFVYFCVLLH